jgi:MoaA/NifB/PqqE/SkfB family radical SAM enzyme
MGTLKRPFKDMEWELVLRLAEEMKALGIRLRYLHEMGEPLLYPRVYEAIDLFPGVVLSTNATLLDGERARRLLETSLGTIRLCIDTLRPDVYPKVRNGGRFDEVVDNVRSFLELAKGRKIRVEIQKMISRLTHDETTSEFREFFRLDRYPNAVVIEKTCEGLDRSEATELHEAYYGCFQGTPYRWFVVLSNGDVSMCCYDYDGEQILGNVWNASISEICRSSFLDVVEDGFRRHDFSALPRCAECFRHEEARPPLHKIIFSLGQGSAALKPWLRRFINNG